MFGQENCLFVVSLSRRIFDDYYMYITKVDLIYSESILHNLILLNLQIKIFLQRGNFFPITSIMHK